MAPRKRPRPPALRPLSLQKTRGESIFPRTWFQPDTPPGEPATTPGGLPRENCYVNVLRDAMSVDTLDPCGVYFGTTGGQVYASRDGGDNRAAVVRDLLLLLLRALARGEVEVVGEVTRDRLLDARHPALCGTIRDHATRERRPFVRFFACEQDLSHEPADAPLPEAVAAGREPFLVVGAIAGGRAR